MSKLPPLTIPLNTPTYNYLVTVQYEVLFNQLALLSLVNSVKFNKLVPMLFKLQLMSIDEDRMFEFVRVLDDKITDDELWWGYLKLFKEKSP